MYIFPQNCNKLELLLPTLSNQIINATLIVRLRINPVGKGKFL